MGCGFSTDRDETQDLYWPVPRTDRTPDHLLLLCKWVHISGTPNTHTTRDLLWSFGASSVAPSSCSKPKTVIWSKV